MIKTRIIIDHYLSDNKICDDAIDQYCDKVHYEDIIHYRDDNEIIENFGHRSWDDDDIWIC